MAKEKKAEKKPARIRRFAGTIATKKLKSQAPAVVIRPGSADFTPAPVMQTPLIAPPEMSPPPEEEEPVEEESATEGEESEKPKRRKKKSHE